jgi:amidase
LSIIFADFWGNIPIIFYFVIIFALLEIAFIIISLLTRSDRRTALMTETNDLATRSISELARAIESGETSAVELTQTMLERIEALNPTLKAFNTVSGEQALARAQQVEQEISEGNYRGPLHGIPVGLKDLLQTKNIRTTVSSKILSDWIPDSNATVVDKLEAAGAISLGKLNMTEFALSGYHPDLEAPVNPWNADHWTGVSSSGSGVATAARLCCAAIGTDTGGSIRLPSAANGVVGIKPTYGRVSRHNAFPLSESLDHIGPLASSVEDAALVLNAIAGYDIEDPTSLDIPVPDFTAGIGKEIRGLRIGVDATYNAQVDPEVGNALQAAAELLAALGAEIIDVDVTGIEEGANYWFTLTGVEALLHHAAFYPQRANEYGPVFRSLLEHGAACSGAEVSRAYTARRRVRQIMNRTFQGVDMLLCPSLAGPAPALEDFPPQLVMPAEAIGPVVLYQAPFNFSGSPTISVPMGFSKSGLPLSLQLVGRHCEEALLVQVAAAYEQATQWHQQIAPGAEL